MGTLLVHNPVKWVIGTLTPLLSLSAALSTIKFEFYSSSKVKVIVWVQVVLTKLKIAIS